MNRIFICSDTHGLMDIKKIKNLVKTKQPDENDYIINNPSPFLREGQSVSTK